MPGKRAAEWRTGDFAHRGHVDMLRRGLDKLKAEPESILHETCDDEDADAAAENGQLEAI